MEAALATGDFWIVSDNHFGHTRLHTELCPWREKLARSEGFKSFDEYQIHLWNKRVSADSVVLNLGDFFINKMNPRKTEENISKILPRLVFKKMYVVKGNHDAKKYSFYDDRVELIDFYLILDILGKRLLFSHYPHMLKGHHPKERYINEMKRLDAIFKKEKCALHFHGHIHGYKIAKPNINVSIDALDGMGPVYFADLLKRS